MRKTIPKKIRKIVYQKYNGHCAYCGCEIPEKGFNVDHLHCLRNYEYTEEFTGIDVHDISNMMPACGSCNRYKATMDLETFREQLQKIPDRLKRDVCTYNIAVRFGMVQEKREPIKFYFEKMKETGMTEVTGKDFKSEYIILKNKIKTKQCSIEYAQGYLYCLINMCVNDDNLYDEYSRAIDDIGEVIICGK